MAKREKMLDVDSDNVIRSATPGIRGKELQPYDPPQDKTAESMPVGKSQDETLNDEKKEVSPPETQPEQKETPKRRRNQSAGYKDTFLKRNEIKTRQCVYISYDVHAKIAKLVRALVDTGNDITVGGYIDTVLSEHLLQNKEEINEVYRQRQGDLL